jgi:hypothetical protein
VQIFKRHIAFFLLLVFNWVLLPASLSHEIFADHEDTDCHFDHTTTTTSVESIHTHCDVFQTNTPVYDIPELAIFKKAELILANELLAKFENSYFHLSQTLLPSRAPPLA